MNKKDKDTITAYNRGCEYALSSMLEIMEIMENNNTAAPVQITHLKERLGKLLVEQNYIRYLNDLPSEDQGPHQECE